MSPFVESEVPGWCVHTVQVVDNRGSVKVSLPPLFGCSRTSQWLRPLPRVVQEHVRQQVPRREDAAVVA